MDAKLRIDITQKRDVWKLQCPECGSRNWRCNDGSFTCRGCSTRLTELEHAGTGEIIGRDEIEFVGPRANWKAKYPTRIE